MVLARANFDYHVADSTMLSLCEGQIIAVSCIVLVAVINFVFYVGMCFCIYHRF